MKKSILVLVAVAMLVASGQALAAQAVLNFTDNSNNEDGFRIDRQLNGGAFTTLATILGANVTTFTDLSVVQPTAPSIDNVYCYRVFAFNSAGNSGFSNTACKTISALPPVPNVPTGLTVTIKVP